MPIHVTCSSCGRTFPKKPAELSPRNYCKQTCRFSGSTPEWIDDGVAARFPMLAQDGSVRAYVIVDAEDVAAVSKWRWTLGDTGYAYRSSKIDDRRTNVLLHREILGLIHGDGIEVDHIDRCKLNCRRGNLRTLPHGGNQQNLPARGGSSQYRGVSWSKRQGQWHAYIRVRGKQTHLGYYATETEAAGVARAARAAMMPYATD